MRANPLRMVAELWTSYAPHLWHRARNVIGLTPLFALERTAIVLTLRKILCPVDFSDLSFNALQFAVDLAGEERSTSCWQAPTAWMPNRTRPGDVVAAMNCPTNSNVAQSGSRKFKRRSTSWNRCLAQIDDELSDEHFIRDVVLTQTGMDIAVAPAAWEHYQRLTPTLFAKALDHLSQHVDLKRYPKRKRGPKKPRPQETSGKKNHHISTAKLLATKSPHQTTKKQPKPRP